MARVFLSDLHRLDFKEHLDEQYIHIASPSNG
jgi:hypothetical protein